jgi:hypothetical protein
MKNVFMTIILAVMMSVAAVAQYPTSPNTGKANTPYSVATFSATFNGAVAVRTQTNTTSSDVIYTSNNGTVAQLIAVRTVDHDIAVDYTSSDFYANDDRTGGTVDTANTAHNVWEGHPFTYTFRNFMYEDVNLSKRSRYIIVNSREVIFVEQVSAANYADRDEWLDFEYSLRIK